MDSNQRTNSICKEGNARYDEKKQNWCRGRELDRTFARPIHVACCGVGLKGGTFRSFGLAFASHHPVQIPQLSVGIKLGRGVEVVQSRTPRSCASSSAGLSGSRSRWRQYVGQLASNCSYAVSPPRQPRFLPRPKGCPDVTATGSFWPPGSAPSWNPLSVKRARRAGHTIPTLNPKAAQYSLDARGEHVRVWNGNSVSTESPARVHHLEGTKEAR